MRLYLKTSSLYMLVIISIMGSHSMLHSQDPTASPSMRSPERVEPPSPPNLPSAVPKFGDEVAVNSETIHSQSLKPFFMPVRDLITPETEWAYCLAACLEYHINGTANYKENLSPEYIFLSLSQKAQRLDLEAGIKFLTSHGTVSAAIVPYGAQTIPSAAELAEKHTISGYTQLFDETSRIQVKLLSIQKALQLEQPVIVEVLTTESFTENGFLQMDGEHSQEEKLSKHSIIISGFNDNNKLFEVRGNYGISWEQGGYSHVPYSVLLKSARIGYVLIP